MSGLKNWKVVVPVIGLLGAIYFIAFHWGRFVQDFYPLDASRIAPNILASLVQYILLGIAAYLLYPPVKRAVNNFAKRHVASIKHHISDENKAIHARLDRHEKLQHHIILNSRAIPNVVPGIEENHQPKK